MVEEPAELAAEVGPARLRPAQGEPRDPDEQVRAPAVRDRAALLGEVPEGRRVGPEEGDARREERGLRRVQEEVGSPARTCVEIH